MPTPSLDRAVRSAIEGAPLALDQALLLVSSRLLARIDRRLPSDVRATQGADDLMQETFADAFRAFPSFRLPPSESDAGEPFFRWLCTIAEHRIVDAVRACRALKRGGNAASVDESAGAQPQRANAAIRVDAPGAQTSLAPLVEILAINSWTPSRSVSGRELEAELQSALQSLFPAYREALELRYLHGLTPGEVAERLGRTEEAVHKLCSRALGALRQALEQPKDPPHTPGP